MKRKLYGTLFPYLLPADALMTVNHVPLPSFMEEN